jgi:hypothetical protein
MLALVFVLALVFILAFVFIPAVVFVFALDMGFPSLRLLLLRLLLVVKLENRLGRCKPIHAPW